MSLKEDIDKVLARTRQIKRNARDGRTILTAAAVYTIGSIQEDFTEEGRPSKWKKLAASTIRSRRRGKGKGGIKILTDTAALKNSISKKVSSTRALVGTNKVQAKRLHFGYPGGTGRGHAKTPARPFMMLQRPEDIEAIGRIFTMGITRK